MNVELVHIEDVSASKFNPRESDPERLSLLSLSLKKLGWLLPIYCTASGEILSGHQRLYVAKEMGCTKVPVVKTTIDMNRGRIVRTNLVFNRATNDLANGSIADVNLIGEDEIAEANKLPDLKIDSDEFFPIMFFHEVEVERLVEINGIWDDRHAIQMTKLIQLLASIDIMPIVVTPEHMIVNGAGRLSAAARAGFPRVPVVIIPTERAILAGGLLNQLSMDYKINSELSDDLMHNAYDAAPHTRDGMSWGATFDLTGGLPAGRFNWERVDHQKAWLKHYGTNVLDFGGGKLWDARHMEAMGASVTVFEPFFDHSKNKVIDLAEDFFADVASGKKFNSMFLSNVMNSVPFAEGREDIVILLAALADDSTIQYATGRSKEAFKPYVEAGLAPTADAEMRAGNIANIYEEGVIVGDLMRRPMMQKFHSQVEFESLFGIAWRDIKSGKRDNRVWVTCQHPREIDPERLTEALEREFNMPFPDGSHLNMHKEAKIAYSKRLGIDLI